MKLNQFDIKYIPQAAIKGQALVDFVCEFSYQPEEDSRLQKTISRAITRWVLYIDGSSKEKSAGARLVLESLEGDCTLFAINFGCGASNNEIEYEAMITGIQLTKEMKADSIEIYNDSQLIVFQILKEEIMASYLAKVKEELTSFRSFMIKRIPRNQNSIADALARMGSANEFPIRWIDSCKILANSKHLRIRQHNFSYRAIGYMDGSDHCIPKRWDGLKQQKRSPCVCAKSARYLLINEQLYKRGFSTPLLRCVTNNKSNYIL